MQAFQDLPPQVPYKTQQIRAKKYPILPKSDMFDTIIIDKTRHSESFEYPKLNENNSQIFKSYSDELPVVQKSASYSYKILKQKQITNTDLVQAYRKDQYQAEFLALNIIPVSSVIKKWDQVNGKLSGQDSTISQQKRRRTEIQKESDYWFNL